MNLPIEIRYHISTYMTDEEVIRLRNVLQIDNSYILSEMENENPAVSLLPLLRLERKLSRLRQTTGYQVAKILYENIDRSIEKRWCNDLSCNMIYIFPITIQERDQISKLFLSKDFYVPKIKGQKSLFIRSNKEDMLETIKICMQYMLLL